MNVEKRFLRARLFTNLRRRRRLDGHAALQARTQAAVAIVDLGPDAELAVHWIHFGADIHNAAAELAVGLARQVDRQNDRAAQQVAADVVRIQKRFDPQPVGADDSHHDIARLHPFAAALLDLHDDADQRAVDFAAAEVVLGRVQRVAFQIGRQPRDVAVFAGLLGFERSPLLCEPQFVEPRFATRSC